MDLLALTGNAIASVNPPWAAVLQTSTGYTTNQDGSRVPTYNMASVTAQVQSLSSAELRQIENLNLQNVVRGVYLEGDVEGLVRSQNKGGDVLTFNRQSWLVVAVLEHWDNAPGVGWAKVAVTLQNPASS